MHCLQFCNFPCIKIHSLLKSPIINEKEILVVNKTNFYSLSKFLTASKN